MDVKINGGLAQPVQTQKKPAANAPQGTSFANSLKAAAIPAGPESPEVVFKRALADRAHPDLRQLDDYLEGMIQKEMKNGGGY